MSESNIETTREITPGRETTETLPEAAPETVSASIGETAPKNSQSTISGEVQAEVDTKDSRGHRSRPHGSSPLFSFPNDMIKYKALLSLRIFKLSFLCYWSFVLLR